jgi:hypothetical protein
VSYGDVLGDKSTMYIRVTLCWGYLIVLWLFHLVCILYCGCCNLFCNVRVSVCVGFVMCGCFGNMCTCIYYVLYCLYCVFVLFRLCIFILICFVYTGVRTTATEWQLNCSNNNNKLLELTLDSERLYSLELRRSFVCLFDIEHVTLKLVAYVSLSIQ